MKELGQKYINIEENEFEKLKEQISYLETQLSSSEKFKLINSEIENELKDKISRVAKRNTENEMYIYDLNGHIRYMEIENQKLAKKQNQMFNKMRDEYLILLSEERDEYLDIFDKQDRTFKHLIESEKIEREKLARSLQIQLDSILKDSNKKQEKIKEFVDEISKFIILIEKIPHQRFAKGKLNEIKRSFQELINDSNTGFYETALITARNVYWQLIELRNLVLQREQEYITYYFTVLKTLKVLIEKANENKLQKIYINLLGKKKYISFDTNYWSFEEYSKYQKNLEHLYNELVKNERIFLVEDIKKIIEDIKKIESTFSQILTDSKNNILSSQIRFNIAQKVSYILKKQFFILVSSAYKDNDFRNEYTIKLKSRVGIEVKIIIETLKNHFGKNQISVYSNINLNNHNEIINLNFKNIFTQ